jgi:hypothetical protein
MSNYETLAWAQLAEEALVAATHISNPELRSAVLVVAMRYASMAQAAAHETPPAKGWSSYTPRASE